MRSKKDMVVQQSKALVMADSHETSLRLHTSSATGLPIQEHLEMDLEFVGDAEPSKPRPQRSHRVRKDHQKPRKDRESNELRCGDRRAQLRRARRSHAVGPAMEYLRCGAGSVPRWYRAVFVEGGGDCLYHAFAYSLLDHVDRRQRVSSKDTRRMGWQPGTLKTARAGAGPRGLRAALAKYVRRHLPPEHGGHGTASHAAQLYELFDPGERSVEALASILQRIETPGMWAEFPETVMLARMSRSCVVMFHSPKGQEAHGALLVHADGTESFDTEQYNQQNHTCSDGARTVYILNRDNKHFEALEPCASE